ncbi:hypothetical protein [Nocardia sp. NBC_01327]|uniref:hypothetical protein n=1 Tax=Nocardia sp. NBC_01327 TaxID=2903593 RepID=UPI002E142C15|nr:hypothetical protein OG326_23845 [Nocardia sp. NBC_01327]
MSIPTEYPVTMLATDGREYEAANASAYVTAVYELGHSRKPAPVPAAPAPAPAPAFTAAAVVKPEVPKPAEIPKSLT